MITGVHISSSKMVITKDGSQKDKFPQFIKDQTVSARVLKQLPHGRTQLLVNGHTVSAKTSMLLTPGQEVQLKVLQEKDNVVLKLIGPAQKITSNQVSSLIRFFSKAGIIPDLSKIELPQVRSLLEDIALKSSQPDKDFLPKLINKSGLVLENKLAQLISGSPSSSDLKANIALLFNNDIKGNLLTELMAQNPGQIDSLKVAASLLETIENFQLLNQQSSESGRFILPFPVFNDSAFKFGQLLIDTGGGDGSDRKDGDKVINISFLLDMSRLGPLRADFSIFKKDISGRFLLQDDATRSYLESMIPELEKGLERIEYHVQKIQCQIAKKEEVEPAVFIESLVQTGESSVISIVV